MLAHLKTGLDKSNRDMSTANLQRELERDAEERSEFHPRKPGIQTPAGWCGVGLPPPPHSPLSRHRGSTHHTRSPLLPGHNSSLAGNDALSKSSNQFLRSYAEDTVSSSRMSAGRAEQHKRNMEGGIFTGNTNANLLPKPGQGDENEEVATSRQASPHLASTDRGDSKQQGAAARRPFTLDTEDDGKKKEKTAGDLLLETYKRAPFIPRDPDEDMSFTQRSRYHTKAGPNYLVDKSGTEVLATLHLQLSEKLMGDFNRRHEKMRELVAKYQYKDMNAEGYDAFDDPRNDLHANINYTTMDGLDTKADYNSNLVVISDKLEETVRDSAGRPISISRSGSTSAPGGDEKAFRRELSRKASRAEIRKHLGE